LEQTLYMKNNICMQFIGKIAYSLFIVTKKWEWGGDWDDGDKVK